MNNIAFSYKAGKSFLHHMPCKYKVVFIPLFNIAIFSLPWYVAALAILIQGILFFALRFTVKEQITDFMPVIFYALFIYLINIFTSFDGSVLSTIKKGLGDQKTAVLVLRFFACVQSASLMFKTSTCFQIREGIEEIEIFIRRFLPCKKEAKFALSISLFINFIPTVFKLWNQLKKAWLVRGGKNNPKMYLVLIPALFSLGLKHSYNTSRAISIRQAQD